MHRFKTLSENTRRNIESVSCVRSVSERVPVLRSARNDRMKVVLINRGLKIENYYIEDEQSFAVAVSVESTRYGDVHNSGGMESNVLYLSVSGDMDIYDEEGWCDPEKETPLAFKKTKELLFGDENYDLKKYTPQFGC